MRANYLHASILAVAVWASASAPSVIAQTAAQPAPQLALPIACDVNVDCWIVNYFDADPGPGARDYANGFRTYDNHRGTDFAVRDRAAMNAGVAVLAAANGTVRARRDGMDDVNVKIIGRDAIAGRECGNGVVIDHVPGWATQYCHLRRGSVSVGKGQTVKAGDVIGMVGQSGLAEFPHVHLSVFHDGNQVDPFATGATQLWRAVAPSQLRYEPVSVYATGFRQAVPDNDSVKQGNIQNQTITASSAAIVYWNGIFGVRTGDRIRQTLHGPGGRLLAEREIVQEKNQIRRFLWIGKKRGAGQWPPGEYVGRTTVTPQDGDPDKILTRGAKISVARSEAK